MMLILIIASCVASVYGSKCTREPAPPCNAGEMHANPRDCRRYYVCESGRVWQPVSCPDGTAYDTGTLRCLPPVRAVCAHFCDQEGQLPVTETPVSITEIQMSQSPMDVTEGLTVKFACRALLEGSVKSHKFSWYVNNTLLSEGSRVDIIREVIVESQKRHRITSTLTIRRVKPEYSGTVHCVVDIDPPMSKNTSRTLAILALPVVSMSPITVSKAVNTQLVIYCAAYVLENGHHGAYETVEIRWYRDGQLISNSNVEQKTSAHSQAAIEVMVENGTMTYSCDAKNKAGTSTPDFCYVHGIPPGRDWMSGSLEPRQGEASRRCGLDEAGKPMWGTPNMTDCTDLSYLKLRQMTQQIEEGFGADNPQLLKTMAISLEKLCSRGGMKAGNLKATLHALAGLARIRSSGGKKEVTDTEIYAVVHAVSNLLSEKNMVAWKSILKENQDHAISLLAAVEHYGDVLAEGIHTARASFHTDNLVLQKHSIEDTEMTDQSYPDRNVNTESPWVTESNDELTFNQDTLQQIKEALKGKQLTVSSAYYRNVAELLPQIENCSVNSRVLSVSVDDLPSETRFHSPIIVKLQFLQNLEDGFYPHCSFWNFSEGNQGSWSSDGCLLIDYNQNEATCQCSHLTSFAIIISPWRPTGIHATILSIISMVGCLVSIVGLCITALIYVILWKQIRSHHNIVFLNLCVALIAANVLFLAGVEQTDNREGCIAIAAFLHYLFLAVFFIMLAEGIELLLYIVFVFHIKTNRETLGLLVAAWGIPAVIVGITMGITKTIGYGNHEFCWLTVDKGVIWAFIAPAIVVILTNTIVLIMVLHSVANSPSAARHREKRKDHWSKSFWNLAVLSPLLGISWIFGVFAVNQHTLVFQYIFAIFNAFQGLFIFLFHCIFNKRVKDAFRDRFKLDSSSGSTANQLIRKRSSVTVHETSKRTSRTTDTTLNSSRQSRTSGTFTVSFSKVRKLSINEINANDLNHEHHAPPKNHAYA